MGGCIILDPSMMEGEPNWTDLSDLQFFDQLDVFADCLANVIGDPVGVTEIYGAGNLGEISVTDWDLAMGQYWHAVTN